MSLPEQPITVEFDLGQHGWGSCSLWIGDHSFVMASVSDTTDALGDLLRAALQIAVGGRRASCSFDREPHEWRLLLQRNWDHAADRDVFTVNVREFESIYAEQPDEAGLEAFTVQCDPEAFVMAIQNAAERVLTDHGHDGYAKLWSEKFPDRAFSALQAALRLPPEH